MHVGWTERIVRGIAQDAQHEIYEHIWKVDIGKGRRMFFYFPSCTEINEYHVTILFWEEEALVLSHYVQKFLILVKWFAHNQRAKWTCAIRRSSHTVGRNGAFIYIILKQAIKLTFLASNVYWCFSRINDHVDMSAQPPDPPPHPQLQALFGNNDFHKSTPVRLNSHYVQPLPERDSTHYSSSATMMALRGFQGVPSKLDMAE